MGGGEGAPIAALNINDFRSPLPSYLCARVFVCLRVYFVGVGERVCVCVCYRVWSITSQSTPISSVLSQIMANMCGTESQNILGDKSCCIKQQKYAF